MYKNFKCLMQKQLSTKKECKIAHKEFHIAYISGHILMMSG